ncbi:MAG: (Fe-S)-binding protein [Anaerolineales bacterium]|nr:(Fe-S)-binding protein [Anaerolineales bacterium]
MLTLVEKVVFLLLAAGSAYYAYQAADRIRRIIRRGRGGEAIDWRAALGRAQSALAKTVTLSPTWQTRFGPTLFHAFVVWGFVYYLLVNLADVLQGFITGYRFPTNGAVPLLDGVYNLLADVLSVGVLLGMAALLVRRFVLNSPDFKFLDSTLVHPKAKAGIRRDSAIVGSFILFHIGARFLGESFHLAEGRLDMWQPFASALSLVWEPLTPATIVILQHICFWAAIGSIMLFVPYFLYSKHIHIFMTPLNFLFKPERKSMGQLAKIDFDDETVSQFGATKLEHLEWPALFDAYACIMCNRCQDQCPAHTTGKALSPSALEINKRYFLNDQGAALAAGKESEPTLLEFAISEEAVWACTTCGACVQICPVGNEPMRDILDIRRSLVLMENKFPELFQTAFRGMERQGNPWNVGPGSRLEWAQGLKVPTVEQNPEFEILYWVGCAPATDPRARQTARAFVDVLNAAGVNFAVLGQMESCTGDSARRSGNEALYFQLATQNTEVINEVMGDAEQRRQRRIVATCPHCLHTLKNEYPDFGGNWEVVHYTQFIAELMAAGKLKTDPAKTANVAFHDPCYLGRHNGVFDAPRQVLQGAGAAVTELPRNRTQSFCCGAGGAQMWKEEEHGAERVNHHRLKEAMAAGRDTLAVACPFCMIMFTDAKTAVPTEMQIKDVAEIVAESLVKS